MAYNNFFNDFLPEESNNYNSQPMISGTNTQEEETDTTSVDDLLQQITKDHIENLAQMDAKAKEEEKAFEEADRKAREEAQAALLRERAEEEALERKRREEEEDAEAARYAAELEAKRQANPAYKLTKLFTRKSKKNEEEDPEESSSEELIDDETMNLDLQEIPDMEENMPYESEYIPEEEPDESDLEDSAENVFEPVQETDFEETPEEDIFESSLPEPEEPVESLGQEKKKEPIKAVTKEKKPVQEKKKSNKKQKKNILDGFFKKSNKTSTKNKSDSEKEEKTPDFEYLATHDKMTGLLNMTAYDMALKDVPAKNLSLVYVDINNLKHTNDLMGHTYGNKLITATAETLNKLFPDNVYRIGGDEFIVLLQGIGSKVIDKKIENFHNTLKTLTKADEDGLIYSASVGYAIGNGKLSKQELQDMADKAMYTNKETYKKAHPELDARATPLKEEKTTQKVPYDQLLSSSQREMKEIIRDSHCLADEEKTERILIEIQQRHQEVLAIFIADPTFDKLFIFRNVQHFIALVSGNEAILDYSYLYVLYEGGPQYYGSDDYYQDVSHLFEDIAGNLKYNRSLSDREIQKIKGINIFKEIYIE